MFAINLAALLFELFAGSDMAHVARDEMLERFESLRAYGRIPRGRQRRHQRLTSAEIAAAILGLVPPNPKWSGHESLVLGNLRTVGGDAASFNGAASLQEVIERVLTDGTARRAVVRLTVSGAESGTNSNGSATLVYETENGRRSAFFVPKEAVSRLQPGAEHGFDGEFRNAPLSRELSFNRRFFERIAKAMELARASPGLLEGHGSEYDAEEAREAAIGGWARAQARGS